MIGNNTNKIIEEYAELYLICKKWMIMKGYIKVKS